MNQPLPTSSWSVFNAVIFSLLAEKVKSVVHLKSFVSKFTVLMLRSIPLVSVLPTLLITDVNPVCPGKIIGKSKSEVQVLYASIVA